MGFRDTFHFNEKAYSDKVRQTDSRVLRKKHHAKVRMQHACSFSVGWGIGLAPATAGISLIGTVYSYRQIHVLRQQATLIEGEIRSREGESAVPRRRKRDWAFGVLIGITGVYIGLGIGHGLHHLIDPIAGGIASSGGTVVTQQVLPATEAIHDAVLNPLSGASGGIHGVVHAISTEIHDAYNSTVPHATSTFPGANLAFDGGEQLGVAGAIAGQKLGGEMATGALLEKGISKSERPNKK